MVVLLGRNGAGKSTTMKSMIGWCGRPRAASNSGRRHRPARTVSHRRLGLGYVPEERRIFTELTVLENPGGRSAATPGAPTWDFGRIWRDLPQPARNAATTGRAHVGRGAADAHHRPHTDGKSVLRAARRAFRRVAPVIVDQMAGSDPRPQGGREAILLSEQNLHFAPRGGRPMPTSSKRAPSASTAVRRSCGRTGRSGNTWR